MAARPRRKTGLSTQQQLLNAIAANPGDTMARLVYADWLEEHGDPLCAAWRKGTLLVTLAAEYSDGFGFSDGEERGFGDGREYGFGWGDGQGDGADNGLGDGSGAGATYSIEHVGNSDGYGYGNNHNGNGHGDGYGDRNGDGDGYGNCYGEDASFITGDSDGKKVVRAGVVR